MPTFDRRNLRPALLLVVFAVALAPVRARAQTPPAEYLVNFYLNDITSVSSTVWDATSELAVRFDVPASAPVVVSVNETGVALPSPLTTLSLRVPADDFLFREQLERCYQLGVVASSRPEKYRFQAYLKVRGGSLLTGTASVTVMQPTLLLCMLTRETNQ